MVTKWIKRGLLASAGLCLAGGLLFGRDVVSYFKTSVRSVQSAAKAAVPIEFELNRARDLVEEIIPEMQDNIRLIAQEEVEVAQLKKNIAQGEKNLGQERDRIARLREKLSANAESYRLGDKDYTRTQVTDDLSSRFERFKEAEMVLAGKKRLLETREKSLVSSMQLLDKTKSQKRLLEDKIAGLDSQYRLVKAASVGTGVAIDNSKLNQTEKLIIQIKKRLDVAERVLAHQSEFVQSLPVDTVDEKDLVSQIDEYFTPGAKTAPAAEDKL